MLSAFSSSRQGRLHQNKNIPCQDYSYAVHTIDGGVLLAAADGLGSCAHAEKASYTALHAAVGFFQSCASTLVHFPNGGNEKLQMAEALLVAACVRASISVDKMAQRCKLPLRECETTLSIAYYDGRHICWSHCGDGAIYGLTSFGTVKKLTVEDNGESIYEVHPLRELRFQRGHDAMEEYAGLCMATDGLHEVFQPQLLRGRVYERLIAYAFGMCDTSAIDQFFNQAERITALEPTGRCQLFDLLSQDESDCFLQDDISLCIARNDDLIQLIDKQYEEPDWSEGIETLRKLMVL